MSNLRFLFCTLFMQFKKMIKYQKVGSIIEKVTDRERAADVADTLVVQLLQAWKPAMVPANTGEITHSPAPYI